MEQNRHGKVFLSRNLHSKLGCCEEKMNLGLVTSNVHTLGTAALNCSDVFQVFRHDKHASWKVVINKNTVHHDSYSN
jgi:hypothetical protein